MPEHEEPIAPYREFARELLLRFERSMASLVAELRADREEWHVRHDEVLAGIAAQRDESRRYFEAENRKLDELIEEGRAQRQALLHILDELRRGGPATAS